MKIFSDGFLGKKDLTLINKKKQTLWSDKWQNLFFGYFYSEFILDYKKYLFAMKIFKKIIIRMSKSGR